MEISLVVVEQIVPGGGRKRLVAKERRNHDVQVIRTPPETPTRKHCT